MLSTGVRGGGAGLGHKKLPYKNSCQVTFGQYDEG